MLAVILAYTGCQKDKNWQPPFEPAVCGAEPYNWIDPSRMGALVSYELDTIFTMSRSSIEALVNTTGYADVLEVRYGVTVYRLSGLDALGRPAERTRISVQQKTGCAESMVSRQELEQPLTGNKWAVVKHRDVFVGYGESDGRRILIVPILKPSEIP